MWPCHEPPLMLLQRTHPWSESNASLSHQCLLATSVSLHMHPQCSVRLHQGLLQTLAHVAKQKGCRLNYKSPLCGKNEQKHMRCGR